MLEPERENFEILNQLFHVTDKGTQAHGGPMAPTHTQVQSGPKSSRDGVLDLPSSVPALPQVASQEGCDVALTCRSGPLCAKSPIQESTPACDNCLSLTSYLESDGSPVLSR